MDELKRARKAKGMSLTEVAELAGLHDEAIARAERRGVDPRFSTVATIADAIGVPLCQLVREDTKHARHGRRKAKA